MSSYLGLNRLLCGLIVLAISIATLSIVSTADALDVSIGVGDTSAVVHGYAPSRAFVSIMVDGSVAATTVASADGYFTSSITAQTGGIHVVEVYAKDDKGNFTSSVSKSVSFMIHSKTYVDIILSSTIYASGRNDTELQFSGRTTPYSNVTILIDGVSTDVVKSDKGGRWKCAVQQSKVKPGRHTIKTRVSGSPNSASIFSKTLIFDISRPVFEMTERTNSNNKNEDVRRAPRQPTILSSKPEIYTSRSDFHLMGKSEPRVEIEIWNNNAIANSVVASATGTWSSNVRLTAGLNTINARSCDRTCGSFSDPLHILYDVNEPYSQLQVSLDSSSYDAAIRERVYVAARYLHGTPPYKAKILWGDGKQDSVISQGSRGVFSHVYTKNGRIQGELRIEDSVGKIHDATFVVTVADSARKWNRVLSVAASTTAVIVIAATVNRLLIVRQR